MKVDECEKCESHVERLSDSILCQFEGGLERHVLSEKNVVGCPKQPKQGWFKKLFRN